MGAITLKITTKQHYNVKGDARSIINPAIFPMTNFVMLSDKMLSVPMHSVVILSINSLRVVMLSVMAT